MARSPLASAALAALVLACGRGDLGSPDPARRAAAVRGFSGERDLPALLVAQRDPSPEVRRAAAEALSAAAGPSSAEALGQLLLDPDPGVASAAAAGLGGMPGVPGAREDLLAAYGSVGPGSRAAIAAALERLGVSLRAAVDLEARMLWDRNLAALIRGGAAAIGAAEELGASQRAEAVERLTPLADPSRTPEPALLAAAARGLGEAGDATARPALEVLLESASGAVAEAAAAALGRLGDPRAADALAAAASEGSARLAAVATESLSALPVTADVGLALCEVAARTMDPGVAARAASAARSRDADCPVRPFVNRLSQPGAVAALSALAALAPRGEPGVAAAERVVRLLDPPVDVAIRTAAALALTRLGGPTAVQAVARRAASAAARVAEGRARWIPGRFDGATATAVAAGADRVAAVLARAPGLPAAGEGAPAPEWLDPVPRAEAEELGALLAAAGALHAPGAADLVRRHLADPLAPVRAGAVSGLAALGGGEAEVAAALRDPDLAVRLSAARGLGRRPSGSSALAAAAGAAVGSGPGADEPEWLETLASGLGDAGGGDAVPALAAMLTGPGAGAAAAALGRIGSPEAATALVAALPRTGAATRARVVEALVQLAPHEAGPSLAAHLTDDRPDVRAAAARAVGRLRLEASAPTLEALRGDYYGRVRRAAVEALAKLPAGAPRARP